MTASSSLGGDVCGQVDNRLNVRHSSADTFVGILVTVQGCLYHSSKLNGKQRDNIAGDIR